MWPDLLKTIIVAVVTVVAEKVVETINKSS